MIVKDEDSNRIVGPDNLTDTLNVKKIVPLETALLPPADANRLHAWQTVQRGFDLRSGTFTVRDASENQMSIGVMDDNTLGVTVEDKDGNFIGLNGSWLQSESISPTKLMAWDTFYYDCNSGGSRSTTTSGTLAEMPGFSNNTYTATRDVTLWVDLTMMCLASAGINGRVYLGIDGVTESPGMYFDAGHWQVQHLTYFVNVDAGSSVTLSARWSASGSSLTVCNASTDGGYPSYIKGFAIPR